MPSSSPILIPQPVTYSVQKGLTFPGDSLLSRHEIRKRVRIVAAVNVVGYSAAMVGLYAAWYSDYERTEFHTFNDWKEWLQVDKVGHLYSAYAESLASMELWR